jgi:hypothetical protein
MRTSKPFLGETPDFDKAFPELKDAIIAVVESDFGNSPREVRWSLRNNGPKMRCSNPRCKRGGYDFEYEVRMMMYTKDRERAIRISCPGDEGSPMGRRVGRECDFLIKGTIKLQYKASHVAKGG